MKNPIIITLTVNPALDKTTHFKGLIAEQKIRCNTPQYDAGGGGINVSKAIHRLQGQSHCVFTSGGPMGVLVEDLIKKEGMRYTAIATQNWTRESFVAVDDNTNLQYRFGFSGETLSDQENNIIFETIQELKPDFLVLSGSLNEGLPADYYQKIVLLVQNSNTKVIADTSGEALQKVLDVGVFLIKPNVGELAKLIGVAILEMDEVVQAAQSLIQKGSAQIVVVSLGPQGAVLVTATQTEFVSAPNVVKKSTVGAGDSMVGAMTWALAQGKSMKEVIQWGVACGSAATMNEGTKLFELQDANRLFAWLNRNES